MRDSLAALALAALLLVPCAALAQSQPDEAPVAAPATPSAQPDQPVQPTRPGPAPQVDELKGDPSHALDNDTPPPFVQRPKRAPQPPRPDLTYARGPEPTGFRGLPWGMSLEDAKTRLGLLPVTDPRPLPGTFHKPDEQLTLGDAAVRTIAYYFPKGRLTGVGIVFEGEANFFLVKDHLISLYGQGRQIGGRYGWTWNNVNIDLRLREGMGELRYTFEPPAAASQKP